MNVEDFRESLLAHFDHFTRTLATDAGEWVVKGFYFFAAREVANCGGSTRQRQYQEYRLG